MIDNIDSSRIQETIITEGSNSSLISTLGIETNEKLFNEIYLATISKSIFEFTPSQKTSLKFIADQCPLAGGNAVLKARAMYALIDYKIFWDNRAICQEVNIELKQMPKTNRISKLSLRPNPANETTTLIYELKDYKEAAAILMNSVGQAIKRFNLNVNETSYEFSTINLRPGIYYVKIKTNGMDLENLKLVIIR